MNKIITEEEREFLLDWIFENEDSFQSNGAGLYRKFLNINKFKNVPSLFFEIKERILKEEEINEWQLDSFFGDIITFNEEDGFVHEHTDPTLPDSNHIRFNLFLSKPESGGNPIYNGKELEYEECCYNKYYVNTSKHASVPVKGKKPRIAISYGISIKNESDSRNFKESGYFVIRNFIEPDFVKFIQSYFFTRINAGQADNGDNQAPHSYAFYGDPLMDTILANSLESLSKIIEINLLPTVSYVRLYGKNDELKIHQDKPHCEISATLALGLPEGEKINPIYFSAWEDKKSPIEINLNPGDLCLYRGCDLWHWREEFTQKWYLQSFLHYVNADGDYKDNLYDGRPHLGMQRT